MLKKCFDGFADEEGAIPAENVGNILSMMGLKVKPTALRSIIEEIDEDGNSTVVNLLGYVPFCFFVTMIISRENLLFLLTKTNLFVIDNCTSYPEAMLICFDFHPRIWFTRVW